MKWFSRYLSIIINILMLVPFFFYFALVFNNVNLIIKIEINNNCLVGTYVPTCKLHLVN